MRWLFGVACSEADTDQIDAGLRKQGLNN